MVPCTRPLTSVSAGDTLRYDTDSLGAFRQTLPVSAATRPFGSYSIEGSDLIYVANPSAANGRDTIQIRSCVDSAAVDCLLRDIVILVGRRGTSSDTSLTVSGGSVTEFEIRLPDLNIACASITGVGNYAYADYRELRFADYVPGSRLRYRASRGSGTDEFQIVICNQFAVCDTTRVTLTVQGPTTTLPFFDDFSYAGPRPDPSLWIEDDVYINDAFGLAAPSYGVATFDGVDGGGRNYGIGYQDVDQTDDSTNRPQRRQRPHGICEILPADWRAGAVARI